MGARSQSLLKSGSISSWSVPVRLSFRSPLLLFVCFLGMVVFCSSALAQNSTAPPPVTFTADQDHQNMMDQLGIKALRPGPSGNEKTPNHANYDESKANPFPDLPDALTLRSGKKVTTATEWWHQRRPEIVENFEREVLGRVPPNVPKVTWTVTSTVNSKAGVFPVIEKQLVGH